MVRHSGGFIFRNSVAAIVLLVRFQCNQRAAEMVCMSITHTEADVERGSMRIPLKSLEREVHHGVMLIGMENYCF
jgi:hypothetical protein